jgi:hypothetical protein
MKDRVKENTYKKTIVTSICAAQYIIRLGHKGKPHYIFVILHNDENKKPKKKLFNNRMIVVTAAFLQ